MLIGVSFFCFLNKFHTLALVFLLKIGLELLELLIFSNEGISQHIDLRLQLSHLLFTDVFYSLHCLVCGCNLSILVLDYFVKLSFFSLKKFGSSLLLFSLPHQTL